MRIRDIWPWLKAEFRWRVLGQCYEVRMTDRFKRQLEALPPEVREEILKAIEHARRNPYSGDSVSIDEWLEDGGEEDG